MVLAGGKGVGDTTMDPNVVLIQSGWHTCCTLSVDTCAYGALLSYPPASESRDPGCTIVSCC